MLCACVCVRVSLSLSLSPREREEATLIYKHTQSLRGCALLHAIHVYTRATALSDGVLMVSGAVCSMVEGNELSALPSLSSLEEGDVEIERVFLFQSFYIFDFVAFWGAIFCCEYTAFEHDSWSVWCVGLVEFSVIEIICLMGDVCEKERYVSVVNVAVGVGGALEVKSR